MGIKTEKIEEKGSSSPHEIVLVSAREKTSLETKISKSNIIDISHDREKAHRKESKLYAMTIPYIYRKYLLTDVKNDYVSCFLYSYLNQRNIKRFGNLEKTETRGRNNNQTTKNYIINKKIKNFYPKLKCVVHDQRTVYNVPANTFPENDYHKCRR